MIVLATAQSTPKPTGNFQRAVSTVAYCHNLWKIPCWKWDSKPYWFKIFKNKNSAFKKTNKRWLRALASEPWFSIVTGHSWQHGAESSALRGELNYGARHSGVDGNTKRAWQKVQKCTAKGKCLSMWDVYKSGSRTTRFQGFNLSIAWLVHKLNTMINFFKAKSHTCMWITQQFE